MSASSTMKLSARTIVVVAAMSSRMVNSFFISFHLMMSAECSADGVGPCFACRCVAISLRSLLLIGIFASPDAFDFASLVEID